VYGCCVSLAIIVSFGAVNVNNCKQKHVDNLLSQLENAGL